MTQMRGCIRLQTLTPVQALTPWGKSRHLLHSFPQSKLDSRLIQFVLLPETPEELSKGLNENEVCKIVKFYKRFEDSFVEIALLAQVVANGGLVQALALVQEGSYIFRSFLDQSVLKLKEKWGNLVID